MLAVNTKVNTDYIASSCWGLTFYFLLRVDCNSTRSRLRVDRTVDEIEVDFVANVYEA